VNAQRLRSGGVATASVIGGGPAGLIAAEVLAAAGVAVTVFDHTPSVGRKFLLAGRGGLNLTHSEPRPAFDARYGPSAPRMAPILDQFGPDDLRAWCAGLGEPTFVGSSGRVFPRSFRATPLLRAWLRRLDQLGVRIEVRHRWVGFGDEPTALRVVGPDGERTVTSDVAVFALGGASWPRVGSDGGWVGAFADAGVEVAPLRAANAGVRVGWMASFLDRFEGVPLKNVAVSVAGVLPVRGDAMITRAGLEGGPVYAVGSAIRAALDAHGRATLVIDLHPDLSVERVIERLGRRREKESASTWLRRTLRLSPVAIAVLRESGAGALAADPAELAVLVKAMPLRVLDLMPIDRAISTAGGIAWSELDDQLMLRRLPGVFAAGEMIDWEAPTGGYLLQASFATGVVAGRAGSRHPRSDTG
jgi:uncharacterized flavoprotein (TIGR03862 family)